MAEPGTLNPTEDEAPSAMFSWVPSAVSSAVLGVVSDGVLITDDSGIILQANSAFARMCQREVWELEGASIAMLVGNSDDPVAEIAAILDREPEWTGRAQLRRSDGRFVDCDAWVRRFDDATGTFWVSVQHEVGVRRRYGHSTIDETEARIHDLVNSLASIRGYTHLLERTSHDDAASVRARLIALTESTTARLEALLKELGAPSAPDEA
ncbi:PAS domain-containing protein [Actinospongicola halichondriae]|uniref:PAS domain-containing protein n=1 Tax=Actinospongicola halichondriae TaxID=3236844 RepID=UPI003D519CFF